MALLVVELAFLGTVGGSVVSALTAPGTQSTTARIAEWARNNGMSPLVTLAEQLTYQAPKVGGLRRRIRRCITRAHTPYRLSVSRCPRPSRHRPSRRCPGRGSGR